MYLACSRFHRVLGPKPRILIFHLCFVPIMRKKTVVESLPGRNYRCPHMLMVNSESSHSRLVALEALGYGHGFGGCAEQGSLFELPALRLGLAARRPVSAERLPLSPYRATLCVDRSSPGAQGDSTRRCTRIASTNRAFDFVLRENKF